LVESERKVSGMLHGLVNGWIKDFILTLLVGIGIGIVIGRHIRTRELNLSPLPESDEGEE